MSDETTEILTISHLSKTFGGNRALSDVSFSLRPGEVHGLVGQNGSGKSTLIKILAGFHQPDPGSRATVVGKDFELGSSSDAIDSGIRFVHQDLGLVSALGTLDNLALGRGYQKNAVGSISWKAEKRAAERLLRDLSYSFDTSIPVSRLRPAERTGVAIARAVEGYEESARVLVLDEPTASLPAAEAERLFEVIRRVNAAGVSIVYVSHRFSELFELCDRVTILKDGKNVATCDVTDLSEDELIRLTIGRDVDLSAHRRAGTQSQRRDGEVVLDVRGLAGETLAPLDFSVKRGEIIGVAGVTGSGREVVGGLLYGAGPREGEVRVKGDVVPSNSPGESIKRGIAYVPADRLVNAAFVDMTMRENLTISRLAPFFPGLGYSRRKERAEVGKWIERFEVRPPLPETLVGRLSGGNQQKIMLGRAVRLEPDLLILDEPTQGVDVGAKATIHQIVRGAAEEGMAVVVCATESEELIDLCDRVLVLVEGQAIGLFDTASLSADDLTELTVRRAPDATAAPKE